MKCFNLEESYGFDDFREIVASLRAENGCPWDRAQTFESLKPCVINETAEVVAAINLYEHTKDAENLCEELGDLLLQVVLQSKIAEEQGLFDLDDVIREISRKMLRRHPHVFGTGFRDAQGNLIRSWDEIKKLEKAGRTEEEQQRQKEEVRLAEKEIIKHFCQKGEEIE